MLGKGFFTFKTMAAESAKAFLFLTPYWSPLGLCVFQKWSPGHHLDNKRGIAINRSRAIGQLKSQLGLSYRILKAGFFE
jgi:hypothetical protein